MEDDRCEACRGTGYNFSSWQGESTYCTSCNGTGKRGDRRWLVVALLVGLALWIAISVAIGIYD